jgi:hypothetical protein
MAPVCAPVSPRVYSPSADSTIRARDEVLVVADSRTIAGPCGSDPYRELNPLTWRTATQPPAEPKAA